MKKGWTLGLVLLGLAGCDRIDDMLHPYDDTAAVRSAPPGPMAGTDPQLYPAPGGVSLQVRRGDCTKTSCFVFKGGKWRALPAADATGIPVLAVEGATGSDYNDDLWRPVGASGNRVLVNTQAGDDNVSHHVDDGLRVGLRDHEGNTGAPGYITAVAFEAGKDGLRLTPKQSSVYISGDKVWLLHVRDDGSADLIDLLAASNGTAPTYCLAGLYLDMRSAWAGPVEKALSPNIFVSRDVGAAAAAKMKAEVDACAARIAAKATP